MIWSKYKKVILVVGAMVFLVLLFLIKNNILFQNKVQQQKIAGLAYNNETVAQLVNQDTDGDGIPDWEERLWGTDPTKKETTPGVPDAVAIEKLKAAQQNATHTTIQNQDDTKLTQTEQFSKELFDTVAAVTQNGQQLDQATTDQIGSSLANQIQNPTPRKVYLTTDLNITNDETKPTVQKYAYNLTTTYKELSVKYTILDVLQKFAGDGNNLDPSVLPQLDPIITDLNKIIDGMVKMQTPESFATLHLEVLNSFESISENLSDIKLYDSDPIVALSAINNYENNATASQSAIQNLSVAIYQKLKN